MDQGISERDVLATFAEAVGIAGEWSGKVTRADGSVEVFDKLNIVTAAGLNEVAGLAMATAGTSAANYIAVGTVSAAASLSSTDFGEVTNGRKAGATVTSSKEFMVIIATYGGAADSVTSLVLESAMMGNHASSGQGVVFNIVNGLGATLGASDTLELTARIRIGSHNI